MKAIREILQSFLFFVIFMTLGVALLVGWSVALAWPMRQILPFSLFEASVLIMIASTITGYTILKALQTPSPSPWTTPSYQDIEQFFAKTPIPETEFIKTASDDTNENWFRYQMANEIFQELAHEAEGTPITTSDKKLKEIAITLGDAVTRVLKVSGRVRITATALKRELNDPNEQIYDRDLLQTAVSAVRTRLHYDDELAAIVRNQTWHV